MMTFEEERDYNNAKFDAIKAKNSIQKLKPELREQLLKELVGALLRVCFLSAISDIIFS